MDIHDVIRNGMVFKGAKPEDTNKEEKVKTKAKKASYVRGQHNSGSAKMKAAIRKKRSARSKKK